mgnify:CR=1 FL=1
MRVNVLNRVKNVSLILPKDKDIVYKDKTELEEFDIVKMELNSGMSLNTRYVKEANEKEVDIYLEDNTVLCEVSKNNIKYDEDSNAIEVLSVGSSGASAKRGCCNKRSQNNRSKLDPGTDTKGGMFGIF